MEGPVTVKPRPRNDPHLMHVTLDAEGEVSFHLECPHDGAFGADCNPWFECRVHSHPDEPSMPEPPYVDSTDYTRMYLGGDGPNLLEAIDAWEKYWKADELFDDLHQDSVGDPAHPEPGCWVRDFVSNMRCGDGWYFDESINDIPIISPLKVDYYDDGVSNDEPVPTFVLWKEPLDGEQADDTTDVRQP